MIVADSDVLIDALRGRQPAAAAIRRYLATSALATTAVTAFELESGATSVEASAAVGRLLGALPILPFDQPAARAAATVRRALEARGASIGMA
ncbi:MAG: type II toxin-antitoxin system VapC family toxin, partial [Gemmatimonadales bacterium]